MTQQKVDRINYLAAKSKTEQGLTDEEKIEQTNLRNEFRADFQTSLNSQLESITIVEQDGKKHKLIPKDNT